MCNGFQLQAALTRGVPYLSRPEEDQAVLAFEDRRDRRKYDTIRLDKNHPEHSRDLRFLTRVRSEVFTWTCQKIETPFWNIAPAGHGLPGYNGRGLNGFQKRLVHQLIRDEHKDLVSTDKGEFIQITRHVDDNQTACEDAEHDSFLESLDTQIGLRWLAEAICPNADE